MKKDGQIDMELNNNVSEILKIFEDKIVLDTKEYKDLVYFKEMYSILKRDFDKNLQSEINNIKYKHEDEIERLNKKLYDTNDENIKLREQIKQLTNTKNKKHWLW